MAKKINITDKLNFESNCDRRSGSRSKIRCGDSAPADGSIRREF